MLNPMLDLSNPCNLNCPYCYIEDKNSPRKKRKPNELTLGETKKIIEEQIKKLSQARGYLLERLELYNNGLQEIIREFGNLEHQH